MEPRQPDDMNNRTEPPTDTELSGVLAAAAPQTEPTAEPAEPPALEPHTHVVTAAPDTPAPLPDNVVAGTPVAEASDRGTPAAGAPVDEPTAPATLTSNVVAGDRVGSDPATTSGDVATGAAVDAPEPSETNVVATAPERPVADAPVTAATPPEAADQPQTQPEPARAERPERSETRQPAVTRSDVTRSDATRSDATRSDETQAERSENRSSERPERSGGPREGGPREGGPRDERNNGSRAERSETAQPDAVLPGQPRQNGERNARPERSEQPRHRDAARPDAARNERSEKRSNDRPERSGDQPDVARPDISRTDAARPDAARPDAARPERSENRNNDRPDASRNERSGERPERSGGPREGGPREGGSPDRLVIGITLGDFNGVGPEVILKALQHNRMQRLFTPVIYGSMRVLNRYRNQLNLKDWNLNGIQHIGQASHKMTNVITCWNDGGNNANTDVQPGQVTPEAGQAAFACLQRAVEDLKAGRLDALVTAPINKHNMQSEQFRFPGHTEYLAEAFGVPDNLMFMVSEGLRVGVVTAHVPLSQVAQHVTRERIQQKLTLMSRSLRQDFGIARPRIAVLGLNPHAGENGLLGAEEQQLITPLLNDLRQKGQLVFGPFPADGFFGTRAYRHYDAVLAMYHDQGLIPFKTIAFDEGVNFTAGMPVVRTSPDHGTAYDIAGKGLADETSMVQALYVACDVARQRREHAELEANALKPKQPAEK